MSCQGDHFWLGNMRMIADVKMAGVPYRQQYVEFLKLHIAQYHRISFRPYSCPRSFQLNAVYIFKCLIYILLTLHASACVRVCRLDACTGVSTRCYWSTDVKCVTATGFVSFKHRPTWTTSTLWRVESGIVQSFTSSKQFQLTENWRYRLSNFVVHYKILSNW